MNNIKYVIKWFLGLLLAFRYVRGRGTYLLVWGHIGEAVYTLSMLPEIKKRYCQGPVHLLAVRPYEQAAELYRDQYVDLRTVRAREMGCLAVYSQSHVKFHNNIIGGGWFWPDIKYQAEVPEIYIAGYCYNVMDLHLSYHTQHVNITTPVAQNDENLQKLILKNKIRKGRAVLLVPYAQSAVQMEIEWWEKIADILLKRGYQVFTNVKNGMEKAVQGTVSIQIPLKYVPGMIDHMGSCITIRCGLSDLIAVGGCDMQVIYREKNDTDAGMTGLWSWKLGKDKSLYTNKHVIRHVGDLEKFLKFLDEKYPGI